MAFLIKIYDLLKCKPNHGRIFKAYSQFQDAHVLIYRALEPFRIFLPLRRDTSPVLYAD